MGRLLGTVRDLDVQLEGLADAADGTAGWSADARPEDHDPLEELSALLQRERDAARAAMLSGLDSVRWERLSRGLAAMVQQGPARRLVATRTPAVIGMPDLIVERHTAVAKAARRAKKSGVVGDFHRLRIRCKRLRYALEFSAEVYGGRTSRYVRQLTALQDELGLMQDAEVASIRLADLATGAATCRRQPCSSWVASPSGTGATSIGCLQRLPNELKRVRGREWRDLLDVMERRRSEAEAARPPLRSTLRAVPAPPAQPAEAPTTPTTPVPARRRPGVLALTVSRHVGHAGHPGHTGHSDGTDLARPPRRRAWAQCRGTPAAVTPRGMTRRPRPSRGGGAR